jgi:hypothetical protein
VQHNIRMLSLRSVFKLFAAASALLVVCMLLSPRFVQAQSSSADVLGTVMDATGAVVPDAKVTITNTGTGISVTATSGKTGDFIFTNLQPGTYKLTAEGAGFKSFVAEGLTLAVGDRARVNPKMVIGDTSESVSVSAGTAPQLDTDTSSIGTLLTQDSVQDLPLNGRNLTSLITLQAGVTEGSSSGFSSGSSQYDRRQTSSISANGQSDVSNTNLLDGLDNNERLNGSVGVRPSIDGVDQVKITTGLYTAEVGRSAGGVFNVITKAGSNQFHGSLYEYVRNDAFDAKGFDFGQSTPKAELRQNQFGGSIGGPIKKDKTFFWGDYEAFRLVSGATKQALVPTLAARTALLEGSAVTIGDGTSLYGTEVTVPQASIDAAGKGYFLLYPEPNTTPTTSAQYNYIKNYSSTQYTNTVDLRLDHHFNGNNTIFAHYSINDIATLTNGGFPTATYNGVTYAPGPGDQAAQRYQNLSTDYMHVYSSNLLMELKAGYLRTANNVNSLNAAYSAQNLGFDEGSINTEVGNSLRGLPQITLNNNGATATLGDENFTPLTDFSNSFIYQGSLTWNHKAHSVKVGANIIRRQLDVFSSSSTLGSYTFQSNQIKGSTGNPLADLLEGKAASVQRSPLLHNQALRTWEANAFAQDDWRYNSWLTLNLGIRYDLFTPYTERSGYLSNFDTTINKLVSPILQDTQHANNRAGVQIDYHNVAPRIGFAASLPKASVLRGGFGMTYYPGIQTIQAALANAPLAMAWSCGPSNDAICPQTGYETLNTLNNDGTTVDSTLGTDYMLNLHTGTPTPSSDTTLATDVSNYAGSRIQAVDMKMKTAYLYQYSLQVEKQLGANTLGVGYVGSLGRRLPVQPNINQKTSGTWPIPSITSAQVQYLTSEGQSTYNALQATFQRRLNNGLTVNANYTWSHVIGDAAMIGEVQSTNICSVDTGCFVANLADASSPTATTRQRYDWGNGDVDVRQRLTVMFNYQIPFAKNLHGALGYAAKGWTVNAIVVTQTSLPFTVMNQGDVSGYTGLPSDRPNVVGKVNKSSKGMSKWFNTDAFKAQTSGVLGNEHRNQYYGPHNTKLDASLFKDFPLVNNMKLQFRAEAYNVSNTPSFAVPTSHGGAVVDSGTFGQITSTANGYNPRLFQLALKLAF